MRIGQFKKTIRKYKSFGLDTMCFIYHFEGHATYGPLTKFLFSHLEDNKLPSYTSTLTLAEMFANEKIQANPLLKARDKEKLLTMPGLSILPVDIPLSEGAAFFRFQYELPLIDAIQLAAAVVSQAEVFVTNDSHFRNIQKPAVLILDDFVKS